MITIEMIDGNTVTFALSSIEIVEYNPQADTVTVTLRSKREFLFTAQEAKPLTNLLKVSHQQTIDQIERFSL